MSSSFQSADRKSNPVTAFELSERLPVGVFNRSEPLIPMLGMTGLSRIFLNSSLPVG